MKSDVVSEYDLAADGKRFPINAAAGATPGSDGSDELERTGEEAEQKAQHTIDPLVRRK
jgi:hypothetical protein